jgi:hypothetical protein
MVVDIDAIDATRGNVLPSQFPGGLDLRVKGWSRFVRKSGEFHAGENDC